MPESMTAIFTPLPVYPPAPAGLVVLVQVAWACIDGGSRILAVLGADGCNLFNIGSGGESLNGVGVAAHRNTAHRVVGGVEDFGAGLVAYLLPLLGDLVSDALDLSATVDGGLYSGEYAGGLGLFEGALALESNEGANGAVGFFHAVAEDLLLEEVGVFGSVGGGA